MNITYNNLSSPSNILTFTEVPNILKIEEIVSGAKSDISLRFEGNLRQTVTADSQYYISILGETITNVMDASTADNKRFYISGDKDGIAMSVCRALRNCGGLAAEFNIIHNGSEVGLIAKTIGNKGLTAPNVIQRNIPSDKLTVSIGEGSSYSVLFNSKIDVDVYSGSTSDDNNYVATLEKNWYGNECAFDVSPILSTISQYGYTQPYELALHLIKADGEWQYLGKVNGNTTIGYHANQSDKYKYAQGVQMLLNKGRGENGVMKLYTYSNYIPYSVLCGSDTGGWNVTVSVKDSAFNEVYANTTTGHRTSSSYIIDGGVSIPQTAMTNGYYVDITVGVETTRFNIIKPLKATEYYQRVLWRNEYGGISFFDFTGARSESDTVDIETYEKNIFDYHENPFSESKMIYINDYKKNVSLTSYLT